MTSGEIQKPIEADRTNFVLLAHGLHAAATLALTAINAKDATALQEAGGTIDAACKACHLKYWYPNQENPEQTK